MSEYGSYILQKNKGCSMTSQIVTNFFTFRRKGPVGVYKYSFISLEFNDSKQVSKLNDE